MNKKLFVIMVIVLSQMMCVTSAFNQLPLLEIKDAVCVNGSATMDVDFTANGHKISAAAFSIDYDSDLVYVDHEVVSTHAIVAEDLLDEDGELDVAMYDFMEHPPGFPDGTIMKINFKCDSTSLSTAHVKFSGDPKPSLGNTDGQSVPVRTVSGTVTLSNLEMMYRIFISIVSKMK